MGVAILPSAALRRAFINYPQGIFLVAVVFIGFARSFSSGTIKPTSPRSLPIAPLFQ
jgi:hypothetical protein